MIACSAAIVVLLCIGIFVPWGAQASTAPPVATGDVSQRIEQLRQRFPDGSFFTASGFSCYHGPNGSCNNCDLHHVMARLGYSPSNFLRQSWTCVSFARYAFWWIFGISHDVYAFQNEIPWGTTSIPREYALPGDLFIWNGSNSYPYTSNQHMAIYLGDGWFFDSNSGGGGGTANVTYGTRLSSLGAPSRVLRANNYDAINSGLMYRWAEPYEKYDFVLLSSLISRFTLPNPVGTVYVELRYAAADGEIVSTRAVEINPGDAGLPVIVGFIDINPGVYSLIFTQPGHTSFTINNVIIPDDGSIIQLHHDPRFPDMLPIFPGDITGTGTVDISDLPAFMQNWMSDYENADFSASGQVNIVDLNYLLINRGAESVVVD